jgi:hypothetical protein
MVQNEETFQTITSWIVDNDIKTETGALFDLSSHLYQFDFLIDESPNIVLMKAAQVGITTGAGLKTIYEAHEENRDCIYVMPTSTDSKDMVSGKINRIINQNPILQDWIVDKDSVEQKQIGTNMIYFRGSWTERAALSVSADTLTLDEFDRSKQDILEQYESRTQHSRDPRIRIFSNPSIEGVGVHKYWLISDQKHWFIECPSCHKQQYLDWPSSIDPVRQCYQCKFCKAELSDENRRQGRWVKKYLDRPWSGYWISLLMNPMMSAKKILEYHETKTPEYFYNFVLGLPYLASDSKLTQEQLFKNLTPTINLRTTRTVIGMDTGLPNWVVMGNSDGIFFQGSFDGYDEVRSFMRQDKTAILVVDAQGDLYGSRELREEFPGRVYLCHFSTDRKTYQLVRWGENDEDGNVVADKSRMIELIVGEFRNERIPLQGTSADWHIYWVHWDHFYKTKKMDEQLHIERSIWLSTKPDHLATATLYWRVGMSRFGDGGEMGMIINADEHIKAQRGFVMTEDGGIPLPHPTHIWKISEE